VSGRLRRVVQASRDLYRWLLGIRAPARGRITPLSAEEFDRYYEELLMKKMTRPSSGAPPAG
jgi:hypothetical protein